MQTDHREDVHTVVSADCKCVVWGFAVRVEREPQMHRFLEMKQVKYVGFVRALMETELLGQSVLTFENCAATCKKDDDWEENGPSSLP